MCRVLEVSRSGFYAWRSRDASAATVRREELTDEVKAIHEEVKARYGSPRIHAELAAKGHACSVNFVAQVMREAGIAAKTKRKFRQTTDSNHGLPVAENVLDREFDPEKPNTHWCADITYIPTREGWLYLAAVEDLFSRRIVGWSMAATMTSRLVVDALSMPAAEDFLLFRAPGSVAIVVPIELSPPFVVLVGTVPDESLFANEERSHEIHCSRLRVGPRHRGETGRLRLRPAPGPEEGTGGRGGRVPGRGGRGRN
jgi:putative transposase